MRFSTLIHLDVHILWSLNWTGLMFCDAALKTLVDQLHKIKQQWSIITSIPMLFNKMKYHFSSQVWSHMGQVMKVRLSCYLVLLSFDSKPGNKTAEPLRPDLHAGHKHKFLSAWNAAMITETYSPILTLKHRETHECVVSTVATDALVLKHQAIRIHNAD